MVESSAASYSKNAVLYVFAVLYFLVLVGVAVVASRRKRKASSSAGELDGHFGGSFGAPMLILTTFSTLYSGFTVTGVPSEAYRKGFFSLRWVGATLVTVAAMLLFFPRLRRLAVARRYHSPNDFITDRHRSVRLRLLCAACSVVPLAIFITAQTVAFASVVSGLTLQAVPRWVIMVAFAVFTLALERLGGMNSVVLTDAVQSVIMIAAFLAVPCVLAADFGFVSSFAGPDCPSLQYVAASAASPEVPPEECPGPSASCVPAGCLAVVRPEFYEYPSRADQAGIFWFFFNMIAAPLQPHKIQRAYIAADDTVLKIVIGALLVAPFLAQPPGIVIGLTKAAFDPAWPEMQQEVTAFAGMAEQLMSKGPFEYFLMTVMTCSTLAAIMSTADSLLMGASSVVSMDIFKASLMPSATPQRVVLAGELCSLVLMVLAILAGLNMSVAQFSSVIILQSGMSMQLLPTFGLSLYCDVSEPALTTGIGSGLMVLVALVAFGNPLDPIVPLVDVSVLANFVAVAVVHLLVASQMAREAQPPREPPEPRLGFQELAPLSLEEIGSLMASSKEPDRRIIVAMLMLMVLAVPVYRPPGEPERAIWGVPIWGFIQCLIFLAFFGLGQLATVLWKPGGGKDADADADPAAEPPLPPPRPSPTPREDGSPFSPVAPTMEPAVAPTRGRLGRVLCCIVGG